MKCPHCGAAIAGDNLLDDPVRRRYFAIVHESYDNLPAKWSKRFPSVEHLRKWALIKAGWCDVVQVVAGSTVRQIADAMRKLDRFAVISVNGEIITIFTAKSQTRKNQPKAQFMETAQKVYNILSDMLGTDVEQAA